MLRPIDRTRRDGPLYPGSDRTLRDCIAPHHLVIRIDATIDLASLAEPLAEAYTAIGRPAIAPEVVLRALLLGAIYEVSSHRQLCERISENLAWRWFCFMTLDDEVFDHSTLTKFMDRIGPDAFTAVLDRLNESLDAADLLSHRTYVDSSLIPSAGSLRHLEPRRESDPMPVANREEQVWETRIGTVGDETALPQVERLCYQDAEGRLPLSRTDPDARWRTIRGHPILGYKEHVVVDRSGFILTRRTTPANISDVAGAIPLLERWWWFIRSVTADSGYRAGVLRRFLRRHGIRAYIPLASNQDAGSPPGFIDRYDHLICPTGKVVLPVSVPDHEGSIRFAARSEDCRGCPRRAGCPAPSRAAATMWGSTYRIELRQAERQNATPRFAREQRRRQTIVEGVFARLDRLGGTRARFCGLSRVGSHGAVCAIAHNILKALTKRRYGRRVAGVLPRPAATPALPVLLLLDDLPIMRVRRQLQPV